MQVAPPKERTVAPSQHTPRRSHRLAMRGHGDQQHRPGAHHRDEGNFQKPNSPVSGRRRPREGQVWPWPMASGTKSLGPSLEVHWDPAAHVRLRVEPGQSHLITDCRMLLDIAQPRSGQSSGRRTPDEEIISASTNPQPPFRILATNVDDVPCEGHLCLLPTKIIRSRHLVTVRYLEISFSLHLSLALAVVFRPVVWTTSSYGIR